MTGYWPAMNWRVVVPALLGFPAVTLLLGLFVSVGWMAAAAFFVPAVGSLARVYVLIRYQMFSRRLLRSAQLAWHLFIIIVLIALSVAMIRDVDESLIEVIGR